MERHAGDFGNIEANSEGVADFEKEIPHGTSLFGENSIKGRTLVIHAKEDTFIQPTGGSGARLVCGILEGFFYFLFIMYTSLSHIFFFRCNNG